jgi:hypothetical protein
MPDSVGSLTRRKKIYTGTFPLNVNIANTSTHWAGRHWAMIMLPLPADRHKRLNIMAHELFHRAQPHLRFSTTNQDNNHLDTQEGRILLRLELNALLKAIGASNESDEASHLTSALLFRKYRHALFPGSAVTENLLELNEGLAEYTGIMLSGRSHEEMKQHFIGSITRFLTNTTYVRSFPYETIPVYGYLLSQHRPQWNLKVASNTSLPDFFIASLSLTLPADLSEAVHSQRLHYDGEKIESEEKLREEGMIALKESYRRKFVTDRHLEIRFEQMNISFEYTNLMPLDGYGVVYPSMQITDNWGILKVTNGGLISPGWDKVVVSQPDDLSNPRIINGAGWALELHADYGVHLDSVKNIYILIRMPSK